MVFQKLLCEVLRESLQLKAYKLSIVQSVELPVQVSLNRNYPSYNSVYFATLWQFKTLCMVSE
jgi:hypothetical protein